MDTLHQPPDSGTDPQAATPYFLSRAEFRREAAAEAARRGLGPDPLAA
jgi:hypothetical protein